MNTIHVVLCILVNQATYQMQDIYSANILVEQRTVSEGSNLYVTCNMFGQRKHPLVTFYLLKDGKGFLKRTQKQNLFDVTFKISRVHHGHSGNYSCLYSAENYILSTVSGKSQDVVEILVIAHLIPAALLVAGPPTVTEGNRVEFKCTFSETLQTLNNCQLIYCCLKKNETFLQMQVFDVAQMEANFTIESAVMRDSGHYSCLLLPSKCYQKHWIKLRGTNTVFLDVQEGLNLWGALSFAMKILVLLFSLGLCWISKNCLKVSCMSCEQPDTIVTVQTDVELQEVPFQLSEENVSVSMENQDE